MDGCFSKSDSPEIIPVSKLGSLLVAELWHGPTGAFKDLALSVVGRLADLFLRKQGKKATVLVGTSGDTGSASIHSVLGSQNVNIIVLYPRGRITCVKELQMTTVNAPNVKVYSLDGTSDHLDIPIKKLFAEYVKFAKKYMQPCQPEFSQCGSSALPSCSLHRPLPESMSSCRQRSAVLCVIGRAQEHGWRVHCIHDGYTYQVFGSSE